ncbi:MAG TPA: hypothetical protein VI146_05425 [Nitrososphaeraceae archaeon]
MVDKVPIWFWWFSAVCLVVFIGFLFRIITWFFNKFIDSNELSWKVIKEDMATLANNIVELKIDSADHKRRLDHHDEEIIEFRRKI